MDYNISMIFTCFLKQAIRQNKVVDVVPSSLVIGKQYGTGEGISAIHYGFPDRIQTYYVDKLASIYCSSIACLEQERILNKKIIYL